MTANILAIGDVAGPAGMEMLENKLRGIIKQYDISFTVVNGENADGLGVTRKQAEAIRCCGADVITLGNHTWGKKELRKYLDDCPTILRPSNFAPNAPGRGWEIYQTGFGNVCVINIAGRVGMADHSENPFFEVDKILKANTAGIILIDFHAEATSEKLAMAHYLDGRVTALWGTHTHVQTSDACVFPKGMGYITDLGMTGGAFSVIGMKPDQPVSRFLGNPPGQLEPAEAPAKIEGAIFGVDAGSGKCVHAEAIRIM